MRSDFKTITLEIDDRGVGYVTLGRADKRHAFNALMIAEMREAAAVLEAEAAVRVAVLKSTGGGAAARPVFCAGGDLAWMQAQHEASRAVKREEATKLAMMFRAFYLLSKPLIVRVHGDAFGGGVGLLAVADIVIAAEDACFALTETRLGLVPATIAPFVVAKVGSSAVRSIFITGSRMSAARAMRLGLVSHVVARDALDAAVAVEVEAALAAQPEAMARAKRMLCEMVSPRLDEQLDRAIEHLVECWEGDEGRVAIGSFLSGTARPS